jgi:hypothetical protein
MKTKNLFSPIIPIVLFAFFIPFESAVPVSPVPQAILSGSTTTAEGVPVTEVEITIEGEFSATANTDFDGQFLFSDIPDGSSITITPNKPIEPNLNSGNITISDLIQLRRAVLFIEDFTTPCETFAADVNGTSTGASDPIDGVSTFDQVLISQAILGINTLSPAWEFIPADANTFTGNPIPQSITIDNITGDNQADFLAIQAGDITACTEQVYIDPSLVISVNTPLQVQTGSTFTLPIEVLNFADLAGLQFSVQWDPTVLSFVGPDLGFNLTDLDISNFGTLEVSDGKLRFLWTDFLATGISLPNGSILFGIEFEVIGAPGSFSTIEFADDPIQKETINGLNEISGIIAESGIVQVLSSAAGISGNISSWQGNAVPDVNVELSGTLNDQQLTDANGDYAFADLPLGGEYVLTPQLDEGCQDCITIADIFPLAFHIVGIEQFENPYQYVAADVNNSASLTTLDIVQMQQLIIGAITEFDNNTCWRFVDAAYTFPNPDNPFTESFPESITINDLGGEVQADFVGIKTGDLAGECPPELTATDTSPQLLITFDGEVCPGDIIEIPVSVQNFESLIGFQGTLSWDPAILSFIATDNYGLSSLMGNNFNTALANTGVLPFSWVDIFANPTSLSDGSVLFTLSFNVIGLAGSSTAITISDTPTPALAVDISLIEQPLGGDSLFLELCSSCDDLSILVNPLDTLYDNCCFNLSYDNNYSESLYAVEVEALNGAHLEYNADHIPAPLRRFTYDDYHVLITETNLGVLPGGQFDDFLPFCLSHVTQAPPQIAVRWYDGQFEVVCEELIELDCPVDTNQCLYIVSDSLFCDSNQYQYSLTVKNPISSDFPVGRIKLNVLHPTTGIVVEDSILDLSPPLAIGDTMTTTFIIESDAYLYGEDFCFLLSAHDGPYELLCCAEIEKCIPFPPCEAPCEQIDVMAMPIDAINEDSCCYTFTIKNGYDVPDYFTNIEMNILSEGVYFSALDVPTLPTWWYEEIETGTHLLWNHTSGAIPVDTMDVFDFCIGGVTSTDSVYIEVNWLQEDSIVCYDTLSLYCPECVEITSDTIECLSANTYKYTFHFTNLNDLGLPVNAIRFIDTLSYIIDPPNDDYLLLSNPVPYGQTSTDSPMVTIEIPDSLDVDTFCFTMVMTYLNEDSVNVECCYVEHCIILPQCDEPCPAFTCIPPPNIEFSCADLPDDFSPDNLDQLQALFGEPTVEGDCPGLTWQELPPFFDFDDCSGGFITRFFEAVDGAGNTNNENCAQNITIFETHAYHLRFPEDIDALCDSIPEPEIVIVGEGGCDFIAQTYEDQIFNSNDGCFSIFRTYQVINWCLFDGQSSAQVISRDEDCDGFPGDEAVYVIVQPDGTVYIDRDDDPFNLNPVAFTKSPICDGLTNNNGYWINALESPGAVPSRDLTDVGFWEYTQVITVFDDDPPIIIQDAADTFCSFDNINCTGDVDLAFTVQEDCLTDDLLFSAFLDLEADGSIEVEVTALIVGTYPNYQISITDIPIGTHQFIVIVEDQCGNEETYNLPFEVVDCLAPAPICLSSLTLVLSAVSPPADVDGDGDIDLAAATINASEYILGPLFDCTGQGLNGEVTAFSINTVGTPSDISQTSLTVTCDEIGTFDVEIHVYDVAGNEDFCVASLNVVDGSGQCGPIVLPTVSDQLISYPNPTTGIIYLQPPISGKYELNGMDTKGISKVKRSVYFDGQTPIAVDATHWDNGVYIFRLRNEHGVYQQTKVVKIH